MFGYIRPLRDELKVREYEQYKACYCGLCRALKAQGTPLSSFILSYDFTFLAMLLYDGQDAPEKSCVRCGANPLKRRKACLKFPALSQCADYCIILTWWKLRTRSTTRVFPRPAGQAPSVLKRAYGAPPRGARIPRVRETLEALARLGARSARPSRADQFARLTAALSGRAGDAPPRARQPLYHVGRFIYIIDASDDLSEGPQGQRNVVAERFGLIGGVLTDEAREALENAAHSCRLAAAALELLDPGPTPVLRTSSISGCRRSAAPS